MHYSLLERIILYELCEGCTWEWCIDESDEYMMRMKYGWQRIPHECIHQYIMKTLWILSSSHNIHNIYMYIYIHIYEYITHSYIHSYVHQYIMSTLWLDESSHNEFIINTLINTSWEWYIDANHALHSLTQSIIFHDHSGLIQSGRNEGNGGRKYQGDYIENSVIVIL